MTKHIVPLHTVSTSDDEFFNENDEYVTRHATRIASQESKKARITIGYNKETRPTRNGRSWETKSKYRTAKRNQEHITGIARF